MSMIGADIIMKLKATEPELRANGVAALYVFGSHARGTARSDSDVDVFVDPADREHFGLSEFLGVYDVLRGALDQPVDYGTREGLSKHVRAQVEREAIRVF
jgi:predicted nucleotidyltransferase